MSTHHDHHGHNHSHALPNTFGKAFLIAILSNSLFIILQIVYAYIANSTSLIADAFHNLGDVFGLVLAWLASDLTRRAPTHRTTYGLKKTTILSALTNGLILVFTCGIIVREAISKLIYLTSMDALPVIIIAGIGIVINFTTALLFLKDSNDLNIKGAYLHLMYDAIISAGVVISAAIIYWTHWYWIDPILSLVITVIILKGSWSLFAKSFMLIIDGVPDNISWSAVSQYLLNKEGVENFHDLHIWAISTQENAMSVHLYMPQSELNDRTRSQWVEEIKQQFQIQHVTIQTEKTLNDCNDACNNSTYI